MNPKRFLKATVLVAGGSAGLLSYPLFRFGGGEVAAGVLAGLILATLGALTWLFCLSRAWEKSFPGFLKYFLGGVLIRLGLFVAVTVAVVVSGALHLPGFLGSLFLHFVVFQVLEIRFLEKWTRATVSPAGKSFS